jgi:glutamate racemase
MQNNHPIGVFDSGIGGTSIWAAIHQLLPNEKTIYLADSKNAPYGQKSKDEIIALCIKNTELLLKMECKLIASLKITPLSICKKVCCVFFRNFNDCN